MFDPAKFERFCSRLVIDTKERGQVPMKWLGGQRYVVEEIAKGLSEDIHTFVILKGRQMGISTVSLALDLYWLFGHAGLQGAMVTDNDENKTLFRSNLSSYLEHLPRGAKVPVLEHNRTQLVLKNRSRLSYLVAGTRSNGNLGRGKAVNFMHACCAPGTPVVLADGKVLPIEHVRVGDRVITHNGNMATIIDAVGQPNTKGDLVRITPWLGKSVDYTREHWIPTPRGMVEAGDITMDDWLLMPIRKITHEVTHVTLPTTPERKQGAGSISVGSGATIELTEAFGFACGYYLSEGHIMLQSGSEREPMASGLTYARHRDEVAYAKRAIDAIRPHISSHRTLDRDDSLTTVEYVYGSSLASWMLSTFGRVMGKHVPDEVFTWGKDFCRGLLAGMLSGDGSKCPSVVNGKYAVNKMVLPSIHSSLAMQARDLAVSLGYGWGSMAFQDGRYVRGRHEKPQWRVTWHGKAAKALLALIGAPVVESSREWSTKYRIVDNHVWIKIRKIEKGIQSDVIWDLSVDHEDHTFRTPYMATSNTECSSWGDEEGLASLYATLAQQNPYRMYLFESTARGYNMFYEMWKTAKESRTQRAIFAGWWRNEVYACQPGSAEYKAYWDGAPTSDERVWIAEVFQRYKVSITDRQLAWWRWYQTEQSRGDETLMMQEFPPTEDYAFQLSGSKFFSTERVNQMYQHARQQEPAFFRWKFGLHFEDTAFMATNEDNADVAIWEMPDPRGVYVMGCDPAYGSSEWADEFVISVWRCYADKVVQVAEVGVTEWTPMQYAWVMAHLGGMYKGAVAVLEMLGPGGAVMNELHNLRRMAGMPMTQEKRDIYDAVNNIRDYFYRRQDSLTGNVALQWQTNQREKQRIMETMRSYFERDSVVMNSPWCVEQLRNIRRNGDSIGGEGRAKDDRVIAAAIAICCGWNDTTMFEMQATGRSYAFEHMPRKEGVIKTPLEQGVSNFFRRNGIILPGTTEH